MQSLFHGVREYLTPVLTESSFEDKGLLTPEEFVKAGDLLVYKCPTWRWESGEPNLRRAYLPADKQYLITHNVPCRRRVTSLEENYQTEEVVEGEDEWVATSSKTTGTSLAASCVTDLSEEMDTMTIKESNSSKYSKRGILEAIVDEHFMPTAVAGSTPVLRNLSSFEDDDNLIEDDEAALSTYVVAQEPDDFNDAILRTRTYDVSITYDKYYQTPRVWLFGYDERNSPLTGDEMFQDIMQDYANRTVTMELHPHRNALIHASIHPCQHGAVMKRILANLKMRPVDSIESNEDDTKRIRCDQYLFVFLKFIQSVVPTIDYDYTIEVHAKQ